MVIDVKNLYNEEMKADACIGIDSLADPMWLSWHPGRPTNIHETVKLKKTLHQQLPSVLNLAHRQVEEGQHYQFACAYSEYSLKNDSHPEIPACTNIQWNIR